MEPLGTAAGDARAACGARRRRAGGSTARTSLLAVVAAALLAPAAARPHEVLHQVEWNRAVAVRAYLSDGEVLADATYEIHSPAGGEVAHQKGRTDRDGWIAFVPTTPGAWRVKIVDDSGHGLELSVESPPATASAIASSTAAPQSAAAFVVRPLVGVAAVAALFAVLIAVHRRRGAAR